MKSWRAGFLAIAALAAWGWMAPTTRAQGVAVPTAPGATVAPLPGMPGVVAAPRVAMPAQGIGTTPFLGNTRGLGAYNRNYDMRAYRTTPMRRGWGWRGWGMRGRRWRGW